MRWEFSFDRKARAIGILVRPENSFDRKARSMGKHLPLSTEWLLLTSSTSLAYRAACSLALLPSYLCWRVPGSLSSAAELMAHLPSPDCLPRPACPAAATGHRGPLPVLSSTAAILASCDADHVLSPLMMTALSTDSAFAYSSAFCGTGPVHARSSRFTAHPASRSNGG